MDMVGSEDDVFPRKKDSSSALLEGHHSSAAVGGGGYRKVVPIKEDNEQEEEMPFSHSKSELEVEEFKKSLKKEQIGCMLRMHGKWRTRWDLFMTLLAVWNSFAIPY